MRLGGRRLNAPQAPDDFIGIIDALKKRRVEFMIVGAYAVAFHGHPRDTADFDILVRPVPQNAKKLEAALRDFGFEGAEINETDMRPKRMIQLGRKPLRIDFLTSVSGVAPDELWEKRVKGTFAGREVFYISKESLIRNKRATGRPKDAADAYFLEEQMKLDEKSRGGGGRAG